LVNLAEEGCKLVLNRVLYGCPLTGHVPVRGHLYIMGLFDGYPTCRFCRMETEIVQQIICCCEALVHQCYNVFGKLIVKPRDISTASLWDLCLFIRGTGLLYL